LARKLASDDDELDDDGVWNVRMSASCSSAALVVNVDSWMGFICGKALLDAAFAVGKGERGELYHCEVGWNTKRDFGLNDTVVGSWTLGVESSTCNEAGEAVFEDGVEAGPGFELELSWLDLLRVTLAWACPGFPWATSFPFFLLDLILTGTAVDSLVCETFFVLSAPSGWSSFRPLRSRRNLATSLDREGYRISQRVSNGYDGINRRNHIGISGS